MWSKPGAKWSVAFPVISPSKSLQAAFDPKIYQIFKYQFTKIYLNINVCVLKKIDSLIPQVSKGQNLTYQILNSYILW